VPKVIDFGIAKAIEEPLTDKTLITAHAQLMGTPAYMSPEQAEMGGLDVDTRSDIYSLGVLLYELLTGQTPFDGQALVKQGVAMLRRTLMEIEPPRPSAKLAGLPPAELEQAAGWRNCEPLKLISTVHGDLDWIVLKALEKDRARRYQTANGLALEVQRYLSHEPVQARPPGRLYRLQKLARRNKLVFAATGAVALALIAGLGFSTVMFLREREARKVADHLRVEAEHGRANEQLLREEAESREDVIHAAALLREKRYEEADRLVAKIPPTEDNLEGAEVFRQLGQWHALREEWKLASERFGLLVRVNEPDEPDSASLDFSAQAVVLAMARDRDGYESLRQEMIRRFAAVEDSRVAERILKNTLLLPPGKDTLDRLQPIGNYLTTYVEAMTAKYPDQTAWQLSALGLYHYRQGKFTQGAECCRKSLAYQGPEGPMSPRAASTSFILAMCEQRLGRLPEALAAYHTGQTCVQKKAATIRDVGNWFNGFWFDWLDARVLRTEAAQSLPPAETGQGQ
jgi:tetratricopeptide (TPR) repeat protein